MWQYITVALILATSVVNARPQLAVAVPASAQAPTAYNPQSQSSADQSTPIPIISQSESNGLDGTFNYSYEAGNGIKLQNSGFLKKIIVPRYEGDGRAANDPEKEEEIQVQVGSFSYPSPDGTIITVNYIADENGFQPQGDHLPTPPPIPEEILKSLQEQSQQEAQTGTSAQLQSSQSPQAVTLKKLTPGDFAKPATAAVTTAPAVAASSEIGVKADLSQNEPNFEIIKP